AVTAWGGGGTLGVDGGEPTPAEDRGGEVGARPLHEEAFVALGAVDLQRLDIDKTHELAGPEHAVRRNHEIVLELGTNDDDGVEAAAAVNIDRRVPRILDQRIAGAAVHRCALPHLALRAPKPTRPNADALVA